MRNSRIFAIFTEASTPPNLYLSCMVVILYIVLANVVHLGQEANV
jgi:hypothetical protein